MMFALALAVLAGPSVKLLRLPEGSIQPQAVVAADGTVHVVYFRGRAEAANIYYARLAPGDSTLSSPVRVNSLPDTAGAIGTVRTAQIAIGRGQRVYVAWNGLGPNAANGYPVAYQAFSRLDSANRSLRGSA